MFLTCSCAPALFFRAVSKFQKAKRQRQALQAMHESDNKTIPHKAKPTATKPSKVTKEKTNQQASQQFSAPLPPLVAAPQNSDDPKDWPKVSRGDWQYVYISGDGPFAGKFGVRLNVWNFDLSCCYLLYYT